VLLVEHNMNFVMGVSDKVVALDFGRVIAEGAPAEVRADEALIRAYLGQAH
jgi:branched-chain amino acid transport system ATP-binding protein